MWFTQWKALLLPGIVFYLFLVKWLRFSRSGTMPFWLGYASRATFSRMTVEDAWKIHNILIEFEFPTTFSMATMFALFKAYGIPTISSLLCLTGQFSSKDTVDKRYTDTGHLLLEAVLNPPASPRAIEAIARINYLHSAYRATGKITDVDMLYTLSLFALEPSRWVAKYEWRELTDMERCAVGTLWKHLGEVLGVNFDLLPGSREGWNDGAEWLGQLERWSLNYQNAYMVPMSTNNKVALATLDYIAWKLPEVFKPIGRQIVAAVLDEKLREAMMIWPKKRLPVVNTSGRLYARKYNIQPWYIKPTIMNRWGLSAWRIWLKGGILPGDQGDKYFPQGFIASELGPTALRGCGKEIMDAERLRLESELMLRIAKYPLPEKAISSK